MKMGKKFFGVIAFVAIAAIAGWNYQQNMNEIELSELALENVEALARNETIRDGYANKDCSNTDGYISCTCTGRGKIIFCI